MRHDPDQPGVRNPAPRTRSHVCATVCAALLIFALSGGGCETATAPEASRTSRVRLGDMNVVVEQTVAKLAGSDWMAARGGDSERVVIGVEAVENRSSDVITRSERWYMMQSVANEVISSGLGRARNVSVVIPAARLEAASRRGSFGDSALTARDRNVTHSLTATIESITRSRTEGGAGGEGREDFYSVVYRVVDLESGELVWEDRVEFTRVALGRSFS